MNILVLNAGSSSLKFRLFKISTLRPLSEPEDVIASGHVERIGQADAQLNLSFDVKRDSYQQSVGTKSVSELVQEIIQQFTKPLAVDQPAISIDAVGHRIVHGGARFFEPILIDDIVLKHIRDLTELAPLHNHSGLAGIEAVRGLLPHVHNVALFDTAFHHNLPAVAARYGLPSVLSDRLQLRRYGFHGISYRYVSERLSLILKRDLTKHFNQMRMIVCHLGNGASVCAIQNGQSIDTSMGFTPLEGLIMGSRSGDIDPGLVLHLLRAENMTPDQVDDLLNHQSGLLGLSGKSADLRELEIAASLGHQASQLALECFAYRVRKYIGAYAAALGGVDTLVFTGGIGQNSVLMRARICQGLSFLGLEIDEIRNNEANGKEPVAISAGDDPMIWIVPTDEERQIAREVFLLLRK